MKRTEAKVDESRRGFLKLAAVAAPAAVAGGTAAKAEAPAEPKGNGLRKTAHVQKYLDSARF